jgi:hypothetical protein
MANPICISCNTKLTLKDNYCPNCGVSKNSEKTLIKKLFDIYGTPILNALITFIPIIGPSINVLASNAMSNIQNEEFKEYLKILIKEVLIIHSYFNDFNNQTENANKQIANILKQNQQIKKLLLKLNASYKNEISNDVPKFLYELNEKNKANVRKTLREQFDKDQKGSKDMNSEKYHIYENYKENNLRSNLIAEEIESKRSRNKIHNKDELKDLLRFLNDDMHDGIGNLAETFLQASENFKILNNSKITIDFADLYVYANASKSQNPLVFEIIHLIEHYDKPLYLLPGSFEELSHYLNIQYRNYLELSTYSKPKLNDNSLMYPSAILKLKNLLTSGKVRLLEELNDSSIVNNEQISKIAYEYFLKRRPKSSLNANRIDSMNFAIIAQNNLNKNNTFHVTCSKTMFDISKQLINEWGTFFDNLKIDNRLTIISSSIFSSYVYLANCNEKDNHEYIVKYLYEFRGMVPFFKDTLLNFPKMNVNQLNDLPNKITAYIKSLNEMYVDFVEPSRIDVITACDINFIEPEELLIWKRTYKDSYLFLMNNLAELLQIISPIIKEIEPLIDFSKKISRNI